MNAYVRMLTIVGSAALAGILLAGTAARAATPEELLQAARERLTAAERQYGREHPNIAPALHLVGDCLWNQKRHAESIPYYQRAAAIRLKYLGVANKDTIFSLSELGIAYRDQERYQEAATAQLGALRGQERLLGAEHPDLAKTLHQIGDCYWNMHQRAESLPYYERAAAIRRKQLGPEHKDTLHSLSELASAYKLTGRYRDALAMQQRILAVRQRTLGPDHLDVAQTVHEIADCHWYLDELTEAAAGYQRAITIREKVLGPEHADVAAGLSDLGNTYRYMARYAEAEELQKRALAIREKTLGPNDKAVASSLIELGTIYREQARFAEAEAVLKRAITIGEQAGAWGRMTLNSALDGLGSLYQHQGRFADAETHYKQGLLLCERTWGAESPKITGNLHKLASLYDEQGRSEEAESLLRRSVALREKSLPPEDPDVATGLDGLANFLFRRGRYAEAEPLYLRAVAILEKARGPEHVTVAGRLNNLANLYLDRSQYAKAEPLLNRAIAIWEKDLGAEHPTVAMGWYNLALLYRWQKRYADAEKAIQRAIDIYEKVRGADHPDVADCLLRQARLYEAMGRKAEIGPILDRTAEIYERGGGSPASRFQIYYRRASYAWDDDRRNEALADLRKAMDVAESLRTKISGAEHERAEVFAKYAEAFEQMVCWQRELGDMNEALAAIERSHARSLLDEMNMSGTDLRIGRPAGEKEQLRRTEVALKTQIATLENDLGQSGDRSAEEKSRLRSQLNDAREAIYRHYRDERSTNPVYRNLLSTGAGPPQLSQLQRQLVGSQGLLLLYLLGEQGGYLLVIRPDAARLVALEVDAAAAQTLEITPGPLVAGRLKGALVNARKTGVLQQLSQPEAATKADAKLAALWQILLPAAERKDVTAGKFKRLIIIPDGPLALLPFETLVVQPGETSRTLLDVGPPVLYGPSATVLKNLWDRRRGTAPPPDREPVLTVGDPSYEPAGKPDAAVTQLAARSSYTALGGKLTPLPYSGWESSWVSDIFAKSDVRTVRLTGPQATEAGVRRQIVGRRIIHLACHGLTDQAFGNFFGALALAPGKDTANPEDDGLLTLPEIYALDLKSSELAILSACETNYGPDQRGEGVWALSRGFLVAGSRRVVASNWLVDDEAAASLVSYFCSGIASAEKAGKPPDYAQALQAAKRYVRKQEKWRSPYFWGTFVLVGPN